MNGMVSTVKMVGNPVNEQQASAGPSFEVHVPPLSDKMNPAQQKESFHFTRFSASALDSCSYSRALKQIAQHMTSTGGTTQGEGNR
jgi:hypothetical protein